MRADRLSIEEIYRFRNEPVSLFGTLRWDILHIFDEIKRGLHMIAARHYTIDSISTDSWGLDYVLFNAVDPMLTCTHT